MTSVRGPQAPFVSVATTGWDTSPCSSGAGTSTEPTAVQSRASEQLTEVSSFPLPLDSLSVWTGPHVPLVSVMTAGWPEVAWPAAVQSRASEQLIWDEPPGSTGPGNSMPSRDCSGCHTPSCSVWTVVSKTAVQLVGPVQLTEPAPGPPGTTVRLAPVAPAEPEKRPKPAVSVTEDTIRAHDCRHAKGHCPPITHAPIPLVQDHPAMGRPARNLTAKEIWRMANRGQEDGRRCGLCLKARFPWRTSTSEDHRDRCRARDALWRCSRRKRQRARQISNQHLELMSHSLRFE